MVDGIRKLMNCDVSALQVALRAMPDSIWDIDTNRQKTFEVHRHTRSIRLVWFDLRWSVGEPVEIKRPNYAPLDVQMCSEAIGIQLAEHFQGQMVRLLLAELRPFSKIAPHVDRGDALCLVRRCHAPIFTNPGAEMMSDGKTYKLAVGEAYELDNARLHAAENNASEPRVHLICDVLEPQKVNSSQSRRPHGMNAVT